MIEKWARNDNPRVRDAWLDRVICGSEIIWEKGQPLRVIRGDDGRCRHQTVPHWTTNRTLARQLAGRVHPLRIDENDSSDGICLKALIRRMETGDGLWAGGMCGMFR